MLCRKLAHHECYNRQLKCGLGYKRSTRYNSPAFDEGILISSFWRPEAKSGFALYDHSWWHGNSHCSWASCIGWRAGKAHSWYGSDSPSESRNTCIGKYSSASLCKTAEVVGISFSHSNHSFWRVCGIHRRWLYFRFPQGDENLLNLEKARSMDSIWYIGGGSTHYDNYSMICHWYCLNLFIWLKRMRMTFETMKWERRYS